jgi:TonB dependent receptor
VSCRADHSRSASCCPQRDASRPTRCNWRTRALLITTIVMLPSVGAAGSLQNLTLEEALQELQARGLQLVYSNDLVLPGMRVQQEPRATQARAILEEILVPHALQVRSGPNGLLLLVRADSAPVVDSQPTAFAVMQHDVPPLEEVVVSASLYRFVRDLSFPLTSIDAADLQASPDLGDDPLRAVARLPGMANSDFSARVNMRGGEAGETLVRFDDLRLHEPFHLKDFQSPFSTIGQSVVKDMRIHAGGFPVAFGDRMSGVIDIDPLSPDASRYTEFALSFFNASALTAGRTGDERAEWLASVRRGNLDLLVDALNSAIGRPSYLDFYGHIAHKLTDDWTVSANALVSNDAIVLFDSDHEEEARADYRDAYYWLRFDYQPSAALSGNILLARSNLDSERLGQADQEGVARGELSDERSSRITSLQSDWSARLTDRMLLQFGGEWHTMRGRYDYRDAVEFDVLFDLPGAAQESERTRSLSARPEGDHVGAYANLRFEPLPSLMADAGVRWDRETLSPEPDAQLSPRISLLYSITPQTQLRASWGRYYQSQSINELQISDGVGEFYAPQRADHLIASLQHEYDNGVSLRLEAFSKNYDQVNPRFENLLNTFVLLPELKPDRIRIAPDGAKVTGMEITVRGDGAGPLQWWLSYTRSSAKDRFDNAIAPRSWDQADQLNGGIVWRNEQWELSIAGTYHSGWPTTAVSLPESEQTDESIPVIAVGPRNAERFRSYSSVDARVARTFNLGGGSEMTMFLEVINVLNRTNECCIEYEIENENSLALDTEPVPYLPLIPSLGFVWRF